MLFDLPSQPLLRSNQAENYPQMLLYAALIGVVGGLVATGYYYGLTVSLHLVWQTLPAILAADFPSIPFANHVWIFTTIGGLLVGLTLRWLGLPGEVALVIDKIHDPGRLDWRQTPAMLVTSLLSITAGGSAGPEAPLVQIIGSFGSWLSDRLKLSAELTRLLTFCGMSAALSAFFGAPLGGALFALELPHRRSLEYYEAIIPAIVSAICSFTVFRMMTGMAVSGGIYHLPAYPHLTWIHLVQAAILGAIGSSVAIVFIYLFRSVKYLIQPIAHHTILLAALGGLAIGLIAMSFPQTLFFGEEQIETILLGTGASLGVTMLLAIALAKMLAIACTLHAGFRGGLFFPLFFIGAAVGLAVSIAVPQFPAAISIICMMAGECRRYPNTRWN